ncbi:hypothetical protein BGX31_008302 [Mortierella sp. GBA43]|nr:hypothetical protein BGX31_008302 [Mortierella sp. GBA43]
MSLSGSGSDISYSPLDWTGFFETKRQVTIPKNVDSSEITFTLYEINGQDSKDKDTNKPVILLHHGAGHCGRSFAATARELGKLFHVMMGDGAQLGETTSKDQLNLDIERLALDVRNVLWTLFGRRHGKDEEEHDQEPFLLTTVHETSMPKVFLVGHTIKPLALTMLRSWCENRPDPCNTAEDAVRWAIEADVIRNLESARVSFPGMIVRASDAPDSHYTWRTYLLRSEQYWATWFDGLTGKFLGTAGTAGIPRPFPAPPSQPRLYILAGQSVPAMDDELKAAHQNNVFQLSVFEACGHAVQEDDPTRMGQELSAFAARVFEFSS